MVAVPEFVQKYVDPGVFRVFRRTTVIGLLIVAYTFYQMDEETQAGLKELAAEMAATMSMNCAKRAQGSGSPIFAVGAMHGGASGGGSGP